MQSHGSVTVRLGAVIFGLGCLVYYIIEMMKVIAIEAHKEPTWLVLAVNDFLAIVFSVLQTCLVFWYPRLNVSCHRLLNRFGMLHLVALNIIMWIRTLVRESIHEILESIKETPVRAIQNQVQRDDDKSRLWLHVCLLL